MPCSVIVTGGFGSLGAVVAEKFASMGEKVARIDYAKAPDSANLAMLDIGGVDLTDPVSTRVALDKVIEAHGGIDVLVNIAGGFAWETLADGVLETWRKLHAINLTTALTTTKLALPHLIKSSRGRVVNIGAGGAVCADGGLGAYAASKSAVHRLTEALAAEMRGTSVTVNAVLPSVIDTPQNRSAMPDADVMKWVQPSAIADVIAFIASPEARAVTGALIPVTRGGIASAV